VRALSKVHVFGASGSGTTTLARHLAGALNLRHFDADNYFWEQTDPPFERKTERSLRVKRLGEDLNHSREGWVLSGCVAGWGEPLLADLDLSVFIYLDKEIKFKRLLDRELEEFGARVMPGGDMHESHRKFMSWAKSYEQARPPIRSLALHEQWIANSDAPTARVNSMYDVSSLVEELLQLPPNE